MQYGADNRVVGAWLKDQEERRISVACDLLVGADGRQSTVAKLVDAQAYLKGTNSSGYIFGYYGNLNREGLHWYFCEGSAAGTIPTNGGHHCVFASMPGRNFAAEIRGGVEDAFLRILEMNSPELRGDVERASLQGRLKGFAGGPGYIKQAHGAGWALVGDAGHFKDPLTAHGITDALRDAALLARAILEARTQAMTYYQQVRDALSREFFYLTEEIASFGWDLEEIRALHKRLSASMRAECDYMANNAHLRNLAA